MRKILFTAILLIILWPVYSPAQANTLRDARVGEWAIYTVSNGSMQERHSIIARRKDVVVVKVESIINGRTISSKVENYNISNPKFLRGASGQTTIKIGKHRYKCFAVNRGKRDMFYSNDIPVTGLVAISKEGKQIKEIVKFGN